MAVRMFAAIEVGSFELEMGIYEISGKNRIRQVDHVRHVISLGSGTYNDRKISYEMVEELCRVLEDFSRIMKGYRITEYRAYATSAMREAKNSRIVLEQIRVRTGLTVQIISNSEQRLLTYKALAVADDEFDRNIRKGTAILDVGFGSMQISLFDEKLLVSTENLPLGVLRIGELLKNVSSTAEGTRRIIGEMVESELSNYQKMYLEERRIKHVIGTGENIMYLFRYEDGGKPLQWVTREQFDRLYERLSGMDPEAVEEQFGVSAEYAPLLLPSAVIYKKFLEMTGAEAIWIPGTGLCDGIAAEYALDKKLIQLKHNFDNDIISASRDMARRYRCQGSHSDLVESYVLQIFDAMKRYHKMGSRERLLLQIAVIIHSCGKFISVRNANECAYNIIMSTEIIGLSHLEREIVANVVRYNIRDFDYNMVRMEAGPELSSGSLPDQSDATILTAKLTAMLRLANSMDRSHGQKLKDCRITVKDKTLTVSAEYSGDITLEAVSFEQKAAFFEEIFGIRPVLKQKRRV